MNYIGKYLAILFSIFGMILFANCERETHYFMLGGLDGAEPSFSINNATDHKVEVKYGVIFPYTNRSFDTCFVLTPHEIHRFSHNEFERLYYDNRPLIGVDTITFIFDDQYQFSHYVTYNFDTIYEQKKYYPLNNNFFYLCYDKFDTIESPWLCPQSSLRDRGTSYVFFITEKYYQLSVLNSDTL